MKKIVVILLCACSLGVQAQFSVLKGDQAAKVFSLAIEVKLEESNEFPSYIELKPQSNLSEELFFNLIRSEFELSTSWNFKLLNTSSDKLGFTHNRYRLSYSGIDVAYSSLSVHSSNGSVVSASGNLKIKEPKTTSVGIDENSAQLKAMNFVGAQEYMWDIDMPLHPTKSQFYPSPNLAYLPNYFEGENKLTLAYVFNIYATIPLIRELIFIDAKDGSVVFHENLIHSGGDSKGTAITAYSDTQKIITDSLPSVFRLRDSVRGNGITTLNSQGLRNYTGAVDFLDSNNFWNNFSASLD
jgi:bacillolysin